MKRNTGICFVHTLLFLTPLNVFAELSLEHSNERISSSGAAGLINTHSAVLPEQGTLVLGLQYKGFEQQQSSFPLNNTHSGSFNAWYRLHRYVSVFNTLQTTRTNLGYFGLHLSPGVTFSYNTHNLFLALTTRLLMPPATDNSTYRAKSFGTDITAAGSYVWNLSDNRSFITHANIGFQLNRSAHSYINTEDRNPLIRAGYGISDSNALTFATAAEYRVQKWGASLEVNSLLSTEQWDASNTTLTPSISYNLPWGLTPWLGFTGRISSAQSLQTLPPWTAHLGLSWSMLPVETCCCCHTDAPAAPQASIEPAPQEAPAPEPVAYFKGTVRNEAQEPLNAHIRFIAEHKNIPEAVVASGTFALSMPPGTYQAQCYAEGYIPTSFTLHGADQSTSEYAVVLKKTANRVVMQQNTITFNEPILFASGKSNILPESLPVADEILAILLQYPTMHILMEGHTDNTGKRVKNKILSLSRVNAVKQYLTEQGVDPNRIETIGYGPEKPIKSNLTPKGRAANRRVEIKITSR